MIVFQYSFIFILASFITCKIDILLTISFLPTVTLNCKYLNIFKDITSFLLLFLGLHNISSQQFKIKSFNGILKYFDPPINKFPIKNINSDYFQIITYIEDKTFFIRKQTYNILSIEAFIYKFRQLKDRNKSTINNLWKVKEYVSNNKIIRGYSTLEMQLIRSIGIERGYKFKLRRKIYELIYSYIWFNSLKQYFENNYFINIGNFKIYILHIYFNSVPIKINGHIYSPISKFMQIHEKEVYDPDEKELFFLACCGLKHENKTEHRIKALNWIIMKYCLDKNKIDKFLREQK